MTPLFRSDRAMIRRLWLVLAIVLVLPLVAIVPASAQDADDAPSEETSGEEPTRPPPDTVDEAEGQPAESGTAGEETAVEDEAEAEAPAPEPVVREVVDDGDRTIQIVEHDVSAYPFVDVVVAVPPALAGELQQGSFSLTENGSVRSLEVAKLRDVIEVVVVIDTSGSMLGDPISAATAAAKDFVRSLDDDTRIGVVGFGATARSEAPIGASRDELDTAIDSLVADGETALYDGLVLATEQFSDADTRRFIVVLSDGKDTASQGSLEDAATALESADANLYAITLESADADFAGLRELSGLVNGQVVAASDSASLSATYASIASRLTNQYRLSYRSSASGTPAIAIAVDANGILAVASEDLAFGTQGGSAPAASADQTSSPSTAAPIDTSNPEITRIPDKGGLIGGSNGIYIGAVALFLAVGVAVFLAMSTEPQGPSAFERLNFKPGAQRKGLSQIADRATGIADRFLEKQERRGALDNALERAGLEMRPGEYVMGVAGIAIAAGAVGVAMFSVLHGVAFLVLSLVGGRLFVGFKAKKRQKLFGNQLGDTLMMIAGSLRAGHGVGEAIDTVASQADSPTCEEFTRAVTEARIGRDMVESLYDIAERTESEDFIWVVRAIGINRELGGDLAEILDNVGETIRDRNRLRDQVQALSAEGKVSAMILFALPPGVAAWVRMSNPEYLDSMVQETSGKVMLGMAFTCMVIGGIWLKKLVAVDF